ncbi:MAG: hypothetical protein K2P50_03955 [Lachnospiraceae bacterium]|nr:hypothetical protein [Lachnospiraceae bacterium]
MMYAVRPILKLLLLSALAVCGLLFAVNILRGKQPLQAKDGIRRCIKAFPGVAAAAVLGGVLCMAFLKGEEPYFESFKMGYTYPQASKGLTPNGTTLDVREIFCDEVLEAAISRMNVGNLSPDEIRNTLSINNVKQQSGVSVDNLYVSTEYNISYNASKKTASFDKDILIQAITDSYYDYFVSGYGRKTDILEDDFSEIYDLDYLDINSYMEGKADAIIEYMEMCRTENSTFVSEATQESFGSVRDKAKNFKNVSLYRNKAYILKYGISKDKEQYISRLNYGNRLENVEYMKNLAAYRVRLSAIERYEGDITRAVLVPTRDESGEFYQSRTKIGTDYFADDANRHLRYATGNQLNIETNNYYIERISASEGGTAHRSKADEMVENLKAELVEISRLAVETVKDYDERTSNGYISFSAQDERAFARSCLKKTALYTAALAGAMFGVIFTGGPFRQRKKRIINRNAK